MAKESNLGRAGLAEALAAPLDAGDIEAALSVARTAQMRAPGAEDPRRIVEALELLMSQVWYGGKEGAEAEAHASFARAAKSLEAGDLMGALAEYRSSGATQANAERAERLAYHVAIVIAAAEDQPLPAKPATNPRQPVAPTPHEAPTRVGGGAEASHELPLEELVEDEVADEPFLKTIQEVSETVDLAAAELISERPGPPASPPVETTRVAKDGELPLDELRRLMANEDSDAALDGLLVELESESESIDIDIEVELDDGLGQPVAHTPSKTFRRPTAKELEGGDVLTPPAFESEAPTRRRPSSPPIPRREDLSHDPIHAPLDTGERYMPEHPRYDAADEETTNRVDPTASWSGVPLYENEPATFEPGEVTVEEDRWDAPAGVSAAAEEREAERLVALGDLEKALKIYERLAARQPENTRLWRRIKAIAWMLRRDVDPTEI